MVLVTGASAGIGRRTVDALAPTCAVARKIAQLVTGDDTRLRHPVGNDARWVPRVKSLVPESLFRSVLRRKFGLA